MDKWKNRLLKMNFKKIGICYLILAVIFAVTVGVGTYALFEGKAKSGENQNGKAAQTEIRKDREDNVEADTDQEDNAKAGTDREDGIRGEDHEWDIESIGGFSDEKEGIMVAVCIVGLALFALYWLLVFLLVIKKSIQKGADPMVFGILALCCNLVGVILLYLYCHWRTSCFKCGKIQKKNALYCPHCGTDLHKKCSQCDAICGIGDEYCSNCGKKL